MMADLENVSSRFFIPSRGLKNDNDIKFQERRARQDLVSEVVALREDKKRLENERERAETELKRFTSWVCNAAVDVTTSPVADV